MHINTSHSTSLSTPSLDDDDDISTDIFLLPPLTVLFNFFVQNNQPFNAKTKSLHAMAACREILLGILIFNAYS
jgi:hypothetical protein